MSNYDRAIEKHWQSQDCEAVQNSCQIYNDTLFFKTLEFPNQMQFVFVLLFVSLYNIAHMFIAIHLRLLEFFLKRILWSAYSY